MYTGVGDAIPCVAKRSQVSCEPVTTVSTCFLSHELEFSLVGKSKFFMGGSFKFTAPKKDTFFSWSHPNRVNWQCARVRSCACTSCDDSHNSSRRRKKQTKKQSYRPRVDHQCVLGMRLFTMARERDTYGELYGSAKLACELVCRRI